MSDITLTLLRIGFLALLWSFVLIAIGVMRSDIFGVRAPREAAAPVRAAGAAGAVSAAAPAKAPKPPKPEKPNRKAPTTIVVTEGPGTGSTVTLTSEPVTIGRAAGNTLVLDDDYVSSRHARLSLYRGDWVVEDLGSTNHTFIGRDKVNEPTPVKAGTRILVGRSVLELRK